MHKNVTWTVDKTGFCLLFQRSLKDNKSLNLNSQLKAEEITSFSPLPLDWSSERCCTYSVFPHSLLWTPKLRFLSKLLEETLIWYMSLRFCFLHFITWCYIEVLLIISDFVFVPRDQTVTRSFLLSLIFCGLKHISLTPAAAAWSQPAELLQ